MNKINRPEKKFKSKIDSIIRKNFSILSTYCQIINSKITTSEEDSNESFDLRYNLDKIRVSVRIRKYNYLEYSDITIRSRSKNGGYCELDKLKDGKSQFYFYAWETEDQDDFAAWILLDIDKFRPYLKDRRREIPNSDGLTRFVSYPLNELNKYKAIINSYNLKHKISNKKDDEKTIKPNRPRLFNPDN